MCLAAVFGQWTFVPCQCGYWNLAQQLNYWQGCQLARLLHCQKRSEHAWGIAIYYHKSLHLTVILKQPIIWTGPPGLPEILLCKLNINGSQPVFIAAVYRPPHAHFLLHNDLATVIASAMEGLSHKIICGDFNADQLSSSDDADYVRSFSHINSLKLIDHGFTQVTSRSQTWLDLCIVDKLDTVVSWGKSDRPLGAGHHLVSVAV